MPGGGRKTGLWAALAGSLPALLAAAALDGNPAMHDPSTIIEHGGRYYVYATGAGLPFHVSEDGWTWRRGGQLMQALPGGRPGPAVLERGGNNTWAPDVIRLGERYFVYYSAPGTQPRAAIGLMIGRSLDPRSPDYQWEDAGPVVWSDGIEDSNAIDPGVFLDPTDGRLWLTYGSYFGYIRLVELDPKTGLRKYPDRRPVDIAINSEASVIIHHDGWYYLLVTHGSCCAGADSSYNIRVGRSRKVTGPYLDNMGVDMLKGGGKLFAGSSGRFIGPGHFGLIDLGDGVQKFSLHYEADLDRGGVSVLDIRPLLWRDGWPVAGENLEASEYTIESARTGTVLEMAVQGVPVGGPRRGGPPGAGGYLGGPWFRIRIAGTERTLAATADAELAVVPAFTGAPEQMWRIEQLTDGSWRLMPRAVPGRNESLALSAVGSSFATLSAFDATSDRHRWVIRKP